MLQKLFEVNLIGSLIKLVISFLNFKFSTEIIRLLILPKCPLQKWEDICSKIGGDICPNNWRTIAPKMGGHLIT